jgi:hypothetical protein
MSSSIKGPSSAVSTGTGDVWANPTKIISSGIGSASVTTSSSQYLVGYNFGFSIPTGQQIDGISVRANMVVNDSGGSCITAYLGDYSTSFTQRGVIYYGSSLPTTYYNVIFGDSTNKWGFTPTIDIVNASTFGVALYATNDVNGTKFDVNYVEMTIYYSAASSTYIKTVNGLAKASVKSVNGLLIASVKSINDLT